MKKLVSLVLALMLAMGCAAALAEEPQLTFTYAEVNPEDSLMGQTANAFKAKVEELTGGSVTINIQFSGVLGAEGDVLDTMIGGGGTIDIARVATFSLNSYGTKKTLLLSIPYTFSGREHFWKFAASDLGQEFLNEPSEVGLGVKGMFYVEEGFRNFYFTAPVEDVAGIAGKKIRVSTDPIMTGMVEGLGASPTVVSFTELYTSLSSGVVDGAEQPIVNYQSNAFFEVAPYMLLDQHTLGCGEVIITEDAWNKLSETQQAAFVEAGKYASEFNASLSADIEAQCVEQLVTAGVTFVEVPDKQVLKDACADLIAQYTADYQTEYEIIVGLDQ
jgi:TRAP-type C4-dicarboxylate transport system substrate-binding protein